MYDLVKWDALINNKREGEMGIKDLKVQNESLLLKWPWRFVSGEQGLWNDDTTSRRLRWLIPLEIVVPCDGIYNLNQQKEAAIVDVRGTQG